MLTARGQSCAREYNDSSFPPYGFKITIPSCSKTNITIQKFGICLEINCLKKRFKICHILFIQNPKLADSIFHFVGFFIFLLLMNALVYVDTSSRAFIEGKYSNPKFKKTTLDFVYLSTYIK